MPAISLDYLNKILPKEKQQSIIDSVFGPKMAAVEKAEQTPVEKAEQVRSQTLSDIFSAARQRTEQQRTDDIRMAKFNALGNALTTLVQPLGWAIGGKGTGVTGGVQPYDNRQYLEAFNRAVKASDDLRNIATKEDELRFQLAQQDYEWERARAERQIKRQEDTEDYQKKADIDVKKQSEIIANRHTARMKEIDQRYGWQKDIAEIRGKYRITQNGKDVSDSAQLDAEKKFNTAWKDYTTRIATLDVTPGIDMSNVRIMTKEEFYKWYMEGEGYHVQEKSGGSGSSSPTAPYVTSGSGDAGNGSGTVVAPYVK